MFSRPLVSLSLAAAFLSLSATGLLLFFLKHETGTAAAHTTFALIILVAAALHARNNWRALKGYGKKPGERTRAFFRKELYIAFAPAALLLGATLKSVPYTAALYDWGAAWRTRQENKQESNVVYQRIETNPAGKGVALELDVRKGKAFEYPLFALWIEDEQDRFIETLYVSKVIGSSRFTFGREENGEWVPDVVRRPEALPCWGHRRGVQARDGYFLPDPESPVPDAVSGATPNESFLLRTRTGEPRTVFRVYFEVNQSFDWNEYYSKDRFPDDKIYSGSGKNGQPSVIYAATVDLGKPARYYALNAVGHGHHSGQDGRLDPDLGKLTTALDIVDGVMLKILP